jgi:hypothetical protein
MPRRAVVHALHLLLLCTRAAHTVADPVATSPGCPVIHADAGGGLIDRAIQEHEHYRRRLFPRSISS